MADKTSSGRRRGNGKKIVTSAKEVTDGDILCRLARTIASRRGTDPATSYVATLFAKGDEAMVKKIGEEATEAVMAAMDGDKIRLTAEIADLWFHCLVVLVRNGLGPEDVFAELARREGVSGLQEKAARL
jgi:phosphoribosyl-ATP pyrophosphohydrolase